jgi:hypothetical protein
MSLLRIVTPAILLAAVGCKTVQPIREPAQYIPSHKPNLVVVIDQDNAEIPVAQPMMAGDTLKGIWSGVGDPVAMPLSQVQRIDAIQPNKKRTTLLIATLAVVGIAGGYALAQAVSDDSSTCDYSYQPGTVVGPNGEPRCVGQE